MTVDEMATMYRVITETCKQGSEEFVRSLGDKLKEKYTIREAIKLTNPVRAWRKPRRTNRAGSSFPSP